jgi:hypothetical protein
MLIAFTVQKPLIIGDGFSRELLLNAGESGFIVSIPMADKRNPLYSIQDESGLRRRTVYRNELVAVGALKPNS